MSNFEFNRLSGKYEDVDRPRGDNYFHPLFAVLDGEAVPLEDHMKMGVTRALAIAAQKKGHFVVPPTRLVHDPGEILQ